MVFKGEIKVERVKYFVGQDSISALLKLVSMEIIKWVKSIFAKSNKDSLHVPDRSTEKSAIAKEAMRQYLQTKYQQSKPVHSELFSFRFGQK